MPPSLQQAKLPDVHEVLQLPYSLPPEIFFISIFDNFLIFYELFLDNEPTLL